MATSRTRPEQINRRHGYGILVDALGEAYIAGETTSANFPVTSGALQTTFTPTNSFETAAFITKLNATGSALIYSTFLTTTGGSNNSVSSAGKLALDADGDLLVGGATDTGFPVTSGAYQTTYPTEYVGAGYVAKLNPTLSALIFATYFPDGATSFDSAGNAYVAGGTFATPPYYSPPATAGAFQQTIPAPISGFVAKLSSSGTALVYCTYLGGSTQSFTSDIAVDAAGDAYVTGITYDDDFPITPDAYQEINRAYGATIPPDETPVNSNAYFTVFNPTGSSLIYSTYLGGGTSADQGDTGYDITLDSLGNAYVTGTAGTPNFPSLPERISPPIPPRNTASTPISPSSSSMARQQPP